MRLAVLELGSSPPELLGSGPGFGEVLAAWLRRGLPEAELPRLCIFDGAPLPEPEAYDGYVLSGSEHGVYDDVPWMDPLRGFLTDARGAGKPLLGICFGHQIMADTFGGRAEKVGDQVVGVRRFDIGGAAEPAHVWHQDQVTQAPSGAQVFARSDHCAVGGLAYAFPALSVQFHPEYEAPFLSSVIERCGPDVLPPEKAAAALAEIGEANVRPDLFANRAGDFFRAALSARG